MPRPPTPRLLHPVRHKKATKRTRQAATGDAYVVGGYREDDWNLDCLGLSVPLVPVDAKGVQKGRDFFLVKDSP